MGRPITDVSIVASTLRMLMTDVRTVSASFLGRQGSSYLRFVVSAPMVCNWLLDLAVEVPGEPAPVPGTILLYIQEQPHRRGIPGGSHEMQDMMSGMGGTMWAMG